MTIEAILLDTNVILRSLASDDPEHPQVASAIRNLAVSGARMFVSTQNLYECWAVLTRPVEANGYGLSALETGAKIRHIMTVFPVLSEPPDMVDVWLDLCTRYGVRGKQVHDARLVALMKIQNLPYILTLDKSDFERFANEIVCVHPNELV